MSTPEVTTFERTVETKHSIRVESVEVVPDRHVFRYTEDTARSGAKPRREVLQGVASASQLKTLRAGNSKTAFDCFSAFTDADLANIRRFGYLALAHGDYAATKRQVGAFDWIEQGGSPDNIVLFNSFDHSFSSLDGTIFPSAIRFDYIEAQIDNVHYDLPRLVEILRKRDDVAILAATEKWDSRGRALRYHKGAIEDLVALPGEEIDDIPGYNRDGGRTQTVTFYWTPTSEQHAIIRDRAPQYSKNFAKQIKPGDSRHKVIFDEDWLGLRAGGAARYGDFYGRTLPDCLPAERRLVDELADEDYD